MWINAKFANVIEIGDTPPRALKQSDVSSTMQAHPSFSTATLHFSFATSSGSPCSSGRSSFSDLRVNGIDVPRIAITYNYMNVDFEMRELHTCV